MISLEEARSRVLAGVAPVGQEQIAIDAAAGRVLGEDVAARVSHPPVAVAAMDGYAVRAADTAIPPATLAVIGEAAAGHGFAGAVAAGQAVRIFTGAPLPAGADAVVMQEHVRRDGDRVVLGEAVAAGRFVRRAGLDFAAGEVLVRAGRRLTARDVGLVAAMNLPWVMVRRRPRVAILSTGDEVVMPGEPMEPGQIVGSNGLALAAFVRLAGAEPIVIGTALDTRESLRHMLASARGADLLVTSGGVSVGDYDLVQNALGESGLKLEFYKVAMRPGKPLMYGSLNGVPVLGVPGNPVSALVCAVVFLGPLLQALQGMAPAVPTIRVQLARDLPDNDERHDHLRAALTRGEDGRLLADPFATQDSSMLSRLAAADCLVLRPPHAPAARAGDWVDAIPLGLAG